MQLGMPDAVAHREHPRVLDGSRSEPTGAAAETLYGLLDCKRATAIAERVNWLIGELGRPSGDGVRLGAPRRDNAAAL